MKRVQLMGVAGTIWALVAVPALAQSNRTFVSGHGGDTGSCGLPAPCRSFAYAITQTNAGGEITILDPAGYGAVTITKAISIVNDGVGEAGVTVTSGDAITITAASSDVINLRGLTLVGSGTGGNGITFVTGATLNVQNSVIRGFGHSGINAVSTGSSSLNVSDTIVSNVGFAGGGLFPGINVAPTGSGTVSAFFERTQVIGDFQYFGFAVIGLGSTGTVQATAADCAATGNGASFGVMSTSGKAATTFVLVNSLSVSNAQGPTSDGPNATMYLAGSTAIGDNAEGIQLPGGIINTFGDNYITDTVFAGTLTKVSTQ